MKFIQVLQEDFSPCFDRVIEETGIHQMFKIFALNTAAVLSFQLWS